MDRLTPTSPVPAPAVTTGGTRASRRVLPGVLLVTMVTGIVGSLGSPLIPQIARQEGVSLVSAQWALTAPLIMAAVAAPVVGRIGAARRRRPVLLGCLALVALGTLLAALPLGFGPLLVGRILQGIAFAIVPLAYSVVRTELPPDRARTAFAAVSVANVVSAGLGFPVTALVAQLAGVAGAFWFGFAMTGVAFVVALATIPASTQEAPGRVDLVGALLLGGGTSSFLLGVAQAGSWGWTSGRVLGLMLAGTVLLVSCSWWLLRVTDPLVDLRIATRRTVVPAHVASLLAGCGMYVLIALVMILVQASPEDGAGLGRPVLVAGLMLTPYAAASVLGSRVALRLAAVVNADLLLPLGCALFGLANVGLAFWHSHLWQLTLLLLVAGIGSGMTFNSIPWLLLRHVPEAEIASATGLNQVLRYLGMSLGSAAALTVLDLTAPPGAQASQQGYVVGGLVGFGISLVAAVLCVLLVPRGALVHRESSPAPGGGLVASVPRDRRE